MEKINKERFLKKLLEKKQSAPKNLNEMGAITDLIQREIGFTPKYGRGFWLKRCKGKSYATIELMIEEAKEKINPGKWLAWRLKPKKV